MPNIKDLFENQNKSYQVLSSKNISDLTASDDVESFGYLQAYKKEDDRFFPAADYTKPEHFVKYGSAKRYYVDSIRRIYRMYPYDGSHKEKIEWHNSSSYLDNFIFNTEYPRTNGFLNLAVPSYGTMTVYGFSSTSLRSAFASSSTSQYVSIVGGPHAAAVIDTEDDTTPKDYKSKSAKSSYVSTLANIYDVSKRRASNLAMDGTPGNTVECWINSYNVKSGSDSLTTALFDLWNGPPGGYELSDIHTALGSASYGRFLIEKRVFRDKGLPHKGANFHVTYMSGTSGVERVPVLLTGTVGNITSSGDWNHVAFSVKNSGLSDSDRGLEVKTYLNGELVDRILTGSSVGEVTGTLNANLGAYRYFPTSDIKVAAIETHAPSVTDFEGWGSLSGALDEFRFWKKARTSQDVGRNWFTQVHGGTNSDDANTDLGVYYKFNEGNTTSASFDLTVLDYSGRISNGTIKNYTTGMRHTGSAMVVAKAADQEFKDPIIYSFHPDVKRLFDSKEQLGEHYDYTNNSSIRGTFPDWILDEDVEKGGGHLGNIIQIISQYFDNVQVLTDYLSHLKDIEYTKYREIIAACKDNGGSFYSELAANVDSSLSSSFASKPLPFSKHLLNSVGLNVPELFVDATVLEALSSRNEDEIFKNKIAEVKNQIYQNIYNNINYIFKSKGTEKAFRNLIRCYGVDEELVKINLYGDNVTHEIRDNYRSTAAKKAYVDFNSNGRFSSVVYQMTASTLPYSNNATSSYIPSTADLPGGGFGMTFETEVLFPKKAKNNPGYQPYDYLTASLFGIHTALTKSTLDTSLFAGETTWGSPDFSEFKVYAVKDVNESHPRYAGDAYFQLTSSALGINLTSSVFKGIYDNEKWNLAFRIKPTKYPWANSVVSSTGSLSSYEVSLYGVNTNLDIVSNEFLLSASVDSSHANNFLSGSKRLYLGPHRTNFTGAILSRSDVKISSTRAWMDYLTNDEIKAHARDAENRGVLHPYRNAFVFQTSSSPFYIPRSDLMIFEWDFSQVTSSDALGQFQFQDISSGSTSANYEPWGVTDDRYGGLRDILRSQYAGVGNLFPAGSKEVVQREYIYSAKQVPPEIINSSDMVSILERDDLVFTKESRPIDYFIAVEKSMYQTITQEMLKMFATIQDFNNLIGEPVNRYRGQYKDMEKLRSLFFENIGNSPDLDKYVDFYKWIDASITKFLEQFFPASANYAKDMRTVVENHVLERNSYRTKFPTLEMKQEDPETTILGINELTYNWKYGHGLLPSDEVESNNCLWWGQRAERGNHRISQSVAAVNDDRATILHVATTDNSGSYLKRIQGSTYVLRKLSRPYKEGVTFSEQVHGGVNYPGNKTGDFYKAKVREFGNDNTITFDSERIFSDSERNCDDDDNTKYKEKLKFELKPSTEPSAFRGSLIAPFNMYYKDTAMTASSIIRDIANEVEFVNLHADSYGPNNEISMQSPFTEKYVGGNQHRHVALNNPTGTTENDLDNPLTRPEAFVIKLDGENRIQGPDYGNAHKPRATYTREPLAKRPLNIKNILQRTGSTPSTIIGNYTKNYEVVQTSGRKTNNKYFVEATGTGFGHLTDTTGLWASPEVPFLSGNFDFVLPARKVYNTIFAEKFSAPGSFEVISRGYTDPFSEEYSVYNALPFRNLTVRGRSFKKLSWETKGTSHKPSARLLMSASIWSTSSLGLRSLLTRHAAWGGYDYDAHTSASFHKVNRNALRTIEYDGESTTAFLTGTQHDNWWVQHAIPRSDLQYTWITASINQSDPTNVFGFGYFPPYGEVSSSGGGWESAVNFITASCVGGYRLASLRVMGEDIGSGKINFIPNDFVGLNTNINDPISASANTVGYPSGAFFYKSPTASPGTWRYFGGLVRSGFAGKWSALILNGLNHHRNGPYQHPTWKQIRTGETAIARHHKKNNTFSISVRNEENINKFTVFPRLSKLEDLRGLLSYKDMQGFGHKISRASVTNENYTEPMITSKFSPIRHTLDTVNDKILSELVVDHTYANNLVTFANPALASRIELAMGGRNDIRPLKEAQEQIYDKLVHTYIGGTIPADSNPIKSFKNMIYKETVYPKHQHSYLDKTRGRTKYTETITDLQSSDYTKALGEQRTFWKDSTPYPLPNGRSRGATYARNALGYIVSDPKETGACLDGTTFATDLSVWPLDVTLSNVDAGLTNLQPTGSANGQLSVDTTTPTLIKMERNRSYDVPTASFCYEYHNQQYIFMPHNTVGTASGGPSARPHTQVILSPLIPKWQTGQLANKSPWFNTYEDYALDIRSMAQEYTVIPEFRISEHMGYYLDKGGDFRSINNKFMTLEGGALSQSAATEEGVFDSAFFNEYSHSDFLKHFEIIEKQHEGISEATQVTVKCHGVKKLLPYNGFYPVLRTVQLGNLFSQSFAPFLTGSTQFQTNPYAERLSSMMQPFFNPGILYNTIKSGIAVDWVALTGSDINQASTNETFLTGNAGTFRLPFESLVDPAAYLPTPTGSSIHDGKSSLYYADTTTYRGSQEHVSSSFSVWKGQSKPHYSMAMNNFLAEVPSFFLKGGRFKNLISGPESGIKPFVSGVTYYMDLVTYKTDDFKMYEGPQRVTGSSLAFGRTPVQCRGTHYGPAFAVTGTSDLTRPTNWRFDPAFAPYTPPYFYGKSITTFVFKPHHLWEMLPGESQAIGDQTGFTMNDVLGWIKDYGTVHSNTQELDERGYLTGALTAIPKNKEHPPQYQEWATAAREQMTNASSFNLFDIIEIPSVEFNPQTNQPIKTTNAKTNKFWSISPKFECPTLNFSGTVSTNDIFPDAADGIDCNTRGMWRGYGDAPKSDQGIFFEVKETYPTITYAAKASKNFDPLQGSSVNPPLSASLMQHLGFKTGLRRRVGEVAETKRIYEAVVAIPFKETNGKKKFFPIMSATDPVMRSILSRKVVKSILGQGEPVSPDIYVPGDSIINMVETMQNYVFPPNLDFITNEDVAPFCMYIFEFDHELNRQDLEDVWQGVMPRISMTAEKQTSTISHFLTNNELLNDTPISKDLRWMVFKVKRKAQKSYYNSTLTAKDDQKYKFNLGDAGSEGEVPNYSYNWPYDFFSLVELAKVNTAVQIGGAMPVTPPDITADAEEPMPVAVKPPVQGGPSEIPPEDAVMEDKNAMKQKPGAKKMFKKQVMKAGQSSAANQAMQAETAAKNAAEPGTR